MSMTFVVSPELNNTGPRIVFDVIKGDWVQRSTSRPIAPELVQDTLDRIRRLGHRPVMVLRVPRLKGEKA